MTVNRTTLLDLPLPVTGTESGTWGDTTNNGLTQYVDIAIAGMSNLTSANFTAGALTIETTEGDSSATNISATSAQYAGFRVTSLAANSTITVGNTGTSPARSYRLINADATYNLTFKATGQTGVTLLPGQSALVAFNGTDYVIVGTVGAGSTTDNTVPRFDGTTGKILQSSGITIDDSNNVSGVAQLNITTLDATNIEVTNIKAKDGTAAASIADSTGVISVTANPVLSGGTANGVLYLNGSKVATSGSALTFDGTNLGIGTSSPSYKLDVNAGSDVEVARFSSTVVGDIYSVTQNLAGAGNGRGAGHKLKAGDGSVIGEIFAQHEGGTTNGSIALKGYSGSAQLTALFANYNTGQYSFNSSGYYSFLVNSAEQMRLTSTGLGIGTSSPATKLHVDTGAAGYAITVAANLQTSRKYQFGIDSNSNLAIYETAATSQFLVLSASGNLGLGVTPSAWSASFKALQVSNFGIMVGSTGNTYQLGNAYFDGSAYKYLANSYALKYEMVTGSHAWHTAPSGTAGNAITFTQAMTLDASGNLLLATTSTPAYGSKLRVQGGIESWASQFNAIPGTNTAFEIVNRSSGGSIDFYPANSFAARITSGGTFLIGNGETAASPSAGILSATGGTGTNIAGANLTIRGGASTGTAAGGVIIFSTAAAGGTSGTATNSASERARIDSSGNVGIGTSAPASKLTVGAQSDAGSLSATLLVASDVTASGNAETTIGIGQGGSTVGSWVGLSAGITSGTNPYFSIKTRPQAGGASVERMRITSGGDVVVTGIGGLGYGTGSGGAVTQATSRTTGVTLDKTNGAITLVSAAGTTTWQTFTVTNNKVAATDTVIVNQKSGTDLYQIFVTNVAAGSFKISFATTGGTTTEQPVFNFAVIKAVTA